jgi:hypothetical protein
MKSAFMVEAKQFQHPEEGVHQAAVISLYALGTQKSELYGANKKILVTYELLDDPMDNGDPFTLSKTYTRSFSPKSTLYKDMANILGEKERSKKVDISSILGKNCLIHVEITDTNGKQRAHIKGVMPLDKRTLVKVPINELVLFDFDREIPADCPDWIRKMIEVSPEWQEFKNKRPAVGDFEKPEAEAF